MTTQEVFVAAEKAMVDVVNRIKDDQWEMVPPTWFEVGRTQKGITLRKLINYHAYDDAWVPDVLQGKTVEEVGKKYEGDLLLGDPKGNFTKYNLAAQAAVSGLSELDKIVHLTYGDYSAREYLQHTMCFRGFRVYDLAKMIGTDTRMPTELVQGLWQELGPHMEDYRKMGVFPAAVQVPETSDLQTRLLALAGRES